MDSYDSPSLLASLAIFRASAFNFNPERPLREPLVLVVVGLGFLCVSMVPNDAEIGRFAG